MTDRIGLGNGISTARLIDKEMEREDGKDTRKRIFGLSSIAVLIAVSNALSFAATTDIKNGTTGGSLGSGDTFIQIDKSASDAYTGSATIVFKPQMSPSHFVGTFARPVFSSLTSPTGHATDFYAIWDGKIGDSVTPFPAGSLGNFTIYEGNIDTNQTVNDALTGSDGMKIFAGTVVGHGGVRLEGTAIFITSDTTAATIVGHDLGIQVNVSGGTQLGFHANSTGTYPGTAAFKADGDWVYGFDGGGLDLINLGNLFGHQHIVGQDVGLYIQGYKSGGNSWFMQTVDATGLFRIYDATTGGDRYSISQASTATHTFTGNASITGSTTISGLAGTGSRTVVASSAGLLSAPVSDSRLKRNITPIAKEVDVLALLEDSEIRGVFYDWKDATLGTEREIGFTAQMFEEIPGLTGSMSDTGHAYLNYERITALLWEQNRLLLAQNKALSERIRALENGTQLR